LFILQLESTHAAMNRPFNYRTLLLVGILLTTSTVFSKQKSFLREYVYEAGEADSKISSRAIALGQVKQLLLEELGSYIQSEIVVASTENGGDFKSFSRSELRSITAGITETKIIEEKWNGEQFYLKANITVDEDFLRLRLQEIANNQQELDKMEEMRKRTDSAFAEIERLRQQLNTVRDGKEKENLLREYEAMANRYAWQNTDEMAPRMEVVFVLDATGSMGGMIANAKDKIWAIATTMAQSEPAPELSIGVIAYRDRTDSYVTKQLPLTKSIDELYTQLLEITAAGGGDMPESVNQGLAEAVFDYQWDTSPNTLRSIYLIGDCPPHFDYQDDIPYQKSCEEAVKKDILINTIQCGINSATTTVWKDIAQRGNGAYLSLNQSGNNFAISTPYDEELAKKAKSLDKTRVYYGHEADREAKLKEGMAQEIYDKSNTEEEARRGIYNVTTSSGKKSFLGEGELVQAYAENKVDLDKMKTEEFPLAMQQLSPQERKSYLDKKVKEREDLEAEIKTLNEEREKYINTELEQRSSEAKGSFNSQLHNVFREQAKTKHYNAPRSAKF
jgi:Mg-chelatase subunit ChlD